MQNLGAGDKEHIVVGLGKPGNPKQYALGGFAGLQCLEV